MKKGLTLTLEDAELIVPNPCSGKLSRYARRAGIRLWRPRLLRWLQAPTTCPWMLALA